MRKLKDVIISSSTVSKIQKLAYILRKIGISHFNHDITFGNNKMAMLTDSKELFDLYYDKQLPVICTNESGRTLDPGIYFVKSLAYEYNYIANIISVLDKKFNFHNSLIVIEHEEACQHMFTLSSPMSEHTFLHTILNKLDNIKNFIEFYKLSLREIIKEAKKPKNQITIVNSSDFERNSNNHPLALVNIKQKDILVLKHKDTKLNLTLSVKQSECLKLLLQSYSAKEIAKNMDLSYRTVEHYIENIRNKLNCRNIKELIINYSSQIEE